MSGRLKSVLFMFAITLAFTFAVSAVKLGLQERIDRNESIKLKRVIMKVLGFPVELKADRELLALYAARVKEIKAGKTTLYLGHGEKGRLAGIAFPVGGAGFWGPIHGMAAAKPDGSRLLGVAFYKHNETPGLGGRITEPWFSGQFKGLSLAAKQSGRVFSLTQGGGGEPGRLDAITGATQTSRAVEKFLNRDLARFVEMIKKNPALVKQAGVR